MGILQVAGIALIACTLLLLLRELRPSLAAPLRLAVTVMLTGAALVTLTPIVAQLKGIAGETASSELTVRLFRALGIAMICELCASFCEDLGESALARGVDLFGKMEILILCLPLLERIVGLAKELLQK